MNDFTFSSPTRFIFKKNAAAETGAALAKLGVTKVLAVYGQGSALRSGLVDAVKDSLVAAGIEVACLPGARPNPEVTLVREGIEAARAAGVDAIVAIGGGSVIDTAKAIAVGVPYEGDVWDFFLKKLATSDVEPLPVAAVLTLPAAGSEASDSCVVSNDEQGRKLGINGDVIRPVLAIMDPEVTFTLPPYQTAAGATDMIAHICERWFSGAPAARVTDGIAASLIRSIMEATLIVLDDPEDYDARADLMWASTLAHNGLCGAGRNMAYGMRAGGWESHGLEHELSAVDTTITHGAGLAVMMPAWMRYVWKSDPSRFVDFGRQVFDMEPAGEGEAAIEAHVLNVIDRLKAFFLQIGMPQYLDDFGLVPEQVDVLVATLEKSKGAVFGGFRKIDMEDARAIYLSAFKGE